MRGLRARREYATAKRRLCVICRIVCRAFCRGFLRFLSARENYFSRVFQSGRIISL